MSAVILLILRLALTAALYAFIGWALWILWQDLRSHSAHQASRLAPRLVLRWQVQLSSETEHQAAREPVEQTFSFTASQVLIGRDPASQCTLDDATISARHALLSYHHSQWWVEDLQSRNGTFLNDVPVTSAVVLTSGDRLQCGACNLTVAIGADAQVVQ